MYGKIRVLKFIWECNCVPLKLLTFSVCGFTKQKCKHDIKRISDTMWMTLNRTWYGDEVLAWGDSSASKEHKVFYIPPQSLQRGELVDLEGIYKTLKY
jgi:hypothetical protein